MFKRASTAQERGEELHTPRTRKELERDLQLRQLGVGACIANIALQTNLVAGARGAAVDLGDVETRDFDSKSMLKSILFYLAS